MNAINPLYDNVGVNSLHYKLVNENQDNVDYLSLDKCHETEPESSNSSVIFIFHNKFEVTVYFRQGLKMKFARMT